MEGLARLQSVIEQHDEVKLALQQRCRDVASFVANTIGVTECLTHGYRVVEVADDVFVLRHGNEGSEHTDWGYEECRRFAADISGGFLDTIADGIERQLEADRQLLKSVVRQDQIA